MVFLEIIWMAIKITVIFTAPVIAAVAAIHGVIFAGRWIWKKAKEYRNAKQSTKEKTGADS